MPMAGEPTYKPSSVRYRDGRPDLRQHRLLPVTATRLGCSISSVHRWRPGRFETRSWMNCSVGTPPTELQKAHRGIRGDQQGSWPCAAAAAPRMHPFERRGAATDKRPRPNPNSSTTSDRQFVVASMSESTTQRSLCRKSLAKPRKGHFKISVHTPLLTSSRLRLKSIRAKPLQGRHSVWFRHRYSSLMAYPSDRSGNRVLVRARHAARAHAHLCRTDRPHPALVFL